MSINTVFDIYNATLAADESIVTTIITAIYAQLTDSINNNISTFDFDLTSYMVGLPGVQQNRIIDRVLLALRNAGIHAKTNILPATQESDPNGNPYFTPYFNNISTAINTITVTWYTRNAQEFMKTFC